MSALDQGQLHQLLQASNVSSHEWDKKSKLIHAACDGHFSEPEVLLVSQTDGQFVVVGSSGVALASESGMIKKRIDVKFVPYEIVAKLVAEDGGYKDRRECTIQAFGAGSDPLFKLGWEGWLTGGSVSANEATAERDRVLSALQRARHEL